MKDIEITWQVSDGYAGGAAPQYTTIPRDDWDACETDAERQELINYSVNEDFLEKVSWHITDQPEIAVPDSDN